MDDNQIGSTHDSTPAGLAGTHPTPNAFEFLAAPATAKERNTARLRLIPIACWRLDDIRFAFDSSFVTPDVRQELTLLASLREAHKNASSQYPPLSVFGHADPVGSDEYNKALSGRRATVIYALLIHNTDPGKAVSLWQQIASQENWGKPQSDSMRQLTGLPASSSQSQLIPAYLKLLCPPELQLLPKDFLGQGADAEGKADYQGCSEFNPVLIFSQEKETDFEQAEDHSARNMANATNRRVLILLFRPGSKVEPAHWPCPRASEGIAGCHKRFWSDAEQRRATRLPDEDREFSQSRDTFACRFYQRLTTGSPCERKLTSFRVQLFDELARPIPNASYVASEGVPQQGNADAQGVVFLSDVAVPSTCTLTWKKPAKSETTAAHQPAASELEFSMSVFVDFNGPVRTSDTSSEDASDDKQQAAQRRLHNLGFAFGDSFTENVRFFQREFGAQETGRLNDIEIVLNQRHSLSNPPSRYKGQDGPSLPPAPAGPVTPVPPDPLPDADPLPTGEED